MHNDRPVALRLRARLRAALTARLRAALALVAVGAAACGPGDPLEQVRELQTQGRFEESVAPAQLLLEQRGDDPEVQYRYGLALARTGQLSGALFALRRAMESRDWLVAAGLEAGRTELATDNAEGAVAAMDLVLAAEPDHLDALLLRARALATARNSYERGLADADRALELDPGNIEGMTLRVVNLLGLVKVEDAEKQLGELENATRDADDEASVTFVCAMRAVLAKEKGDREDATRRFDECLAASPADSELIGQAIKFYDETGQPEKAIEVLRKAVAESPASAWVRRGLAERLRRAGEVEEAERVLREGTQIANPAAANTMWVALADHYHELENHSAAADALGHAVELAGAERADSQMRFDYADALVMAGRYDEALAIARDLAVPAQREILEGRVALEQGRPADALEHFGAGLQLWPDNPVARYYAAEAAERVGDFDRALGEYRYSVRAGVAATDARLRLALLNEAMGRYETGYNAARHDVERNPAGLETELVGIRLAARLGKEAVVRASLAQYARRPEYGRAVAAAAEGAQGRGGPAAAVALIRSAPGLDLGDPRNVDALRVLVESLGAEGNGSQALAAVDQALAAHPDVAAYHELRGEALAASAAGADATRAAYERALELDPEHAAPALAGLARLASKRGEVDAALELYARAAAANPDDSSALRAAAELLVAQGRSEEAEARLAEALARDPYDGRSAGRLAELLLARDADLDRALRLASTAARFHGGREAQALLARVHERRGEPELAKEAAERAAGRRPQPHPEPKAAAVQP